MKKWTPLLPFVLITSPLAWSLPVRAENIEHVQQVLRTRECTQCDLSNAGFVFANLSKANLQGADLSNANLSRANLSQADLSGANLTGATLFGANLTGAKLNGTILVGADLRNAYLTNTEVKGVDLTHANLEGVVGLPTEVADAEAFFNLALQASDAQQYGRAVENYSQALVINPEMGAAYLGRSMALFKMGERGAALQDSKIAAELLSQEGDEVGAQTAIAFSTMLETPEDDPFEGNRVGNAVSSIFSVGLSVLKLFVPF